MLPLSVVLLQSDPGTLQSLILPLTRYFRSVREAQSFSDLRDSVAEHSPEVVILDMEIASFREMERLSHDFPNVNIVCNHRLADERMWAAALSAGAVDCCASSDPRSILDAARRNAAPIHAMAA